MINQTALLFFIFLVLLLGVVIAFSYTVIKPAQTLWAVKKGRQIAASGEIGSRWQFDNVCRMLATAPHDLEAAELWQKMKEIRESAENQSEPA